MGYGVRGVSGEYHGPPNDAHITRVKEDPEAGIEAAAVEGKGGFRERTGWGGGLEPVSSRSFCKPSRTCRSRCVRYRWWGNWSVDALGRCWSCRGLFLRVWLNAPPVAPLTLASLPQELPSVPPSFLAAPTSHPRPPRSLSLSLLSFYPSCPALVLDSAPLRPSFRGAPLPSHRLPPRRPTPTASWCCLAPEGESVSAKLRESSLLDRVRLRDQRSSLTRTSSLGGNMEIRALRHRSVRERERELDRVVLVSSDFPPSFSPSSVCHEEDKEGCGTVSKGAHSLISSGNTFTKPRALIYFRCRNTS